MVAIPVDKFLNPVKGQHMPGFMKLFLSAKSVCVFVCVPAPQAIKYHLHEMKKNQSTSSTAFRFLYDLQGHRVY